MRKLAWIVFIFLATASASAQQTVVRVVACDRAGVRAEDLQADAWQPIEARAGGWPSNLGALLDELERRAAVAPIRVMEIERAALDPGQERMIAGLPVRLLSRASDTAEVSVNSVVVRVPAGGTVVVGNRVHFFAVSVLDSEAAARTSDPVRIKNDVVTPPRPISTVNPFYPESARRDRVSGIVIVQVEIDETGNVLWVHVLKGLPDGLSEAAVDAVRQRHFEPATADGKPVAVLFNLTTNFRLK